MKTLKRELIGKKIIVKAMDEARSEKMNSIERLTMSRREISASCFSYFFFAKFTRHIMRDSSSVGRARDD